MKNNPAGFVIRGIVSSGIYMVNHVATKEYIQLLNTGEIGLFIVYRRIGIDNILEDLALQLRISNFQCEGVQYRLAIVVSPVKDSLGLKKDQ